MSSLFEKRRTSCSFFLVLLFSLARETNGRSSRLRGGSFFFAPLCLWKGRSPRSRRSKVITRGSSKPMQDGSWRFIKKNWCNRRGRHLQGIIMDSLIWFYRGRSALATWIRSMIRGGKTVHLGVADVFWAISYFQSLNSIDWRYLRIWIRRISTWEYCPSPSRKFFLANSFLPYLLEISETVFQTLRSCGKPKSSGA